MAAERVGVASSKLGCANSPSVSVSPICTLTIPNILLLRLHEEGNGYVAGVNSCIDGELLTLGTSCSRIETALRKAASKLIIRKKNCKGSRDRQQLKEGTTYVLVGKEETVSNKALHEELERKEVCKSVSKMHYY